MKCDKIQEMFTDYWAGALDPGDKARFESHLAACESCRTELENLNHIWNNLGAIPNEEPSPALQKRFNAMLEGYGQGLGPIHAAPSRRTCLGEWISPIFRLQPVFQLGLGLLLLVGGFFSGYVMRSARNGHEEIADLRTEVLEMRQMLTISLLKQQSASERLKGVSWSSQVTSPDPEFLSTLIHTLDYDTNVDVRLAAVDALAQFAVYPEVRQNLIKSLPRQDSPLVQISLIDLLVQLHERQSIDVLKQLVNNTGQNPEVRNRAKWGLEKLS